MLYISNAFSLQMLGEEVVGNIRYQQINIEDVKHFLDEFDDEEGVEPISAVGHQDTAQVFSNLLERNIPTSRINITLEKGDTLFVGQLMGGRLPEGTKTLPENMKIKWFIVEHS